MPKPNITTLQSAAYRLLREYAQVGRRCPSDGVIAEEIGSHPTTGMRDVLMALVRKELIEVAIIGGWRVVTICSTKHRTRVPDATEWQTDSGVAEIVDRDPCFYCGARGDVEPVDRCGECASHIPHSSFKGGSHGHS